MVIDTACSSTMVALHQAVLSLKANEAAMALVCGANLILNPDMVSKSFLLELSAARVDLKREKEKYIIKP